MNQVSATALTCGALLLEFSFSDASKNETTFKEDIGESANNSGGTWFGTEFIVCVVLMIIATIIGLCACSRMKNRRDQEGRFAQGADHPESILPMRNKNSLY